MAKKNRVKGKKRTALPAFVKRPFEGLPSECDVIALRELVPAGTAPMTAFTPRSRQTCRSASVLTVHTCMSWPAATMLSPSRGLSCSSLTPGPSSQSGPTMRRSTCQ